MRILRFLSAATMVAIFLFSCSRNSVAISSTNAHDEVPALGNLIFRFNEALVNDSMLNRWDSTALISFEPAIKGRFRWEQPDELVFSPAAPLAPATTYEFKTTRELLRNSKYSSVNNTGTSTFHTAALNLDEVNVAWVVKDAAASLAVTQADLYFNYAVAPKTISGQLTVTHEGQPLDYQVISAGNTNKLTLQFPSLKALDKDQELTFLLNKGLLPEGGANPTTEPISKSTIITSPFNLTINDISTDHDGSTGMLTIRTSQQLKTDNFASLIKFSPAVKFTTQVNDDGLLISSDAFDVTKSYTLTIAPGLKGIIGGTLRDQYQNTVAFGKMEPSISFQNSSASYVSALGARNIAVKLVGVPKVKIIISKIYENNILSAEQHSYAPSERSGEENDYENYEGSAITAGDIVYEKEIETRTLPLAGAARLLNLDISDKLPEFKGIYHIKIRSMDDYWVSDSRFISLSDLGLIAREGTDKISVFVNSIKTTMPVDGVTVLAYGSNNQLLGTGSSNAEGVAEIVCLRKNFAGFKPAMIIAKTAGDFNYLSFGKTAINTSRFDISGKKSNATGLDAFIYPERDIYRPGEKVNFAVLVRDKLWKNPGTLPMKIKFLLPNGKELTSFRKNLNEGGALDGSIDVAAAAITGSYTLEVYNSNDVLLASKSFMIEEFVPDRIKVSADLSKNILAPGQRTTLAIGAINFFGPPAANRNYECEIQIEHRSFNAPKFPGYSFELANPGVTFDKTVKEGKTDAKGMASEEFAVKEAYKNTGRLAANFFVTVFDETGRPVSRSASADIFTQSQFFGIGEDGNYYYALNQSVQFPLIATDVSGNAISATAKVEVIKHEYKTILSKSGSYFRYESQNEDKVVSSADVKISGEKTSYAFVPRTPGNYELRVSLPGANGYVKKSFYSYGYMSSDNNSFEVNTDGNIDISSDKKLYNAGEVAKVLFKTPFSGKMLVTTETDRVLSYQYVNVKNRSASIDLKLSSEHLPNVFVTATLIKPHEESDVPLTVAHGFQNLVVEEPARKMNLVINASAASRSHTHQKITVKANPGSIVTLAAVDNGVLQVSNFKTPDPYGYFYAARALDVSAFDLYPLLFPELRGRLSSTGGDGGLEMEKRANPMPNKRIKILSYWSGIVTANGNGDAIFEFDIPQFSGELRLMAVASKNDAFGSAEKKMTVADPIVLSTALPRFLTPGDSIMVPITVTNTLTRAVDAKVMLTSTGAVRILEAGSQTVSIPASSETRVVYHVAAASIIGTAKLSVRVSSGSENYTDETDITVRPASTLQKLTGSGSIAGNITQKLDIGAPDFLPGSGKYHLVISRSPGLQLGSQLAYLVEYPYGCTEQTVSTAFAQLYYGDLATMMQQGISNKSAANYNIMEAIRKIKLRQLYNGGLTLWDGVGKEDWWCSVYAANFLIEAKKAGYDVDKNLLDPLLNYVSNHLRTRETVLYYYNQQQQKKIAPKEIAYSLYVLALAGKPDISTMNYYKSNPAVLALDSKYLLSVAFAIAGDKKRFAELLPASFTGEISVAQTGGSFYSDVRDESIALNCLLDVDPANAQIPVMAQHVADKLKSRNWYSTQECAFALLALGKIAKVANQGNITATVNANGKQTTLQGNTPLRIDGPQQGIESINLTTKGTGRLYYWWESSGIRASGNYVQEDNYLRARRRYFDRNGKPIAGNTFKQNDLVIVQLTLEKTYQGSIENVVLTDLIPAGFEIENPRTKEIPGMEWIKDGDSPTAMDVRDDRINLFVDLYSSRQVYYYAVRAVSPGTYRQGPVSADAMYNGEYHSYYGAGTIHITQ